MRRVGASVSFLNRAAAERILVTEVGSQGAQNVTMSLHEVLRAQAFNHISGDDSQGDPPVPMPNTVVKPLYAESTRLETVREDRALPVG